MPNRVATLLALPKYRMHRTLVFAAHGLYGCTGFIDVPVGRIDDPTDRHHGAWVMAKRPVPPFHWLSIN